MIQRPSSTWTIDRASELWAVERWGQGYFGINDAGHLTIHPTQSDDRVIDLKELVDGLLQRGIELPALIRFTDILKHRVQEMSAAFHDAIGEMQFRGDYIGVYPIKVNQHRQVVEEFLETGSTLRSGLECGSKPELIAAIAMNQREETPIICNGFKDDDYIEMVLYAQKMGRMVLPVVEKYNEIELIIRYADLLEIQPRFGIRVKLSTLGAGRWKTSGGDRSKFGLTITELLSVLDLIAARGMKEGFNLLHFHLGSQITNIHSIKNAITEFARIYAELRTHCIGLEYLDVGGGLGIDYDGSQTNYESSMNYTLEEYARDVIFRVQTVCDDARVPHPTIVTESGRATVAHHSVLVFETVGVSSLVGTEPPSTLPEDLPSSLQALVDISNDVSEKKLLESFHDAVQAYDDLLNSFKLGYLSLEQRSLAERLYYSTAQRILHITRGLNPVPDELADLEAQLADIYFCNFSVFHSLPDSWAVQQLFPILPIHQLDERPTRRGVLADMTCDSDGKVDRFIDLRDIKRCLELHPYTGRPYYLGAFLVGAYQEILGDLHNLFGDTNNVHVTLDAEGQVSIDTVIKGDTVREVLSYVEYDSTELLRDVRKQVERALRRGKISLDESARFLRFYEASLGAYTYLNSRERGSNSPTRVDERQGVDEQRGRGAKV